MDHFVFPLDVPMPARRPNAQNAFKIPFKKSGPSTSAAGLTKPRNGSAPKAAAEVIQISDDENDEGPSPSVTTDPDIMRSCKLRRIAPDVAISLNISFTRYLRAFRIKSVPHQIRFRDRGGRRRLVTENTGEFTLVLPNRDHRTCANGEYGLTKSNFRRGTVGELRNYLHKAFMIGLRGEDVWLRMGGMDMTITERYA